jgi:hypothetical protein
VAQLFSLDGEAAVVDFTTSGLKPEVVEFSDLKSEKCSLIHKAVCISSAFVVLVIYYLYVVSRHA